MRELTLTRPKIKRPEDEHLHKVIDALEQAASQVVKVYKTHVLEIGDGCYFEYTFTTTSKDVHLTLGALGAKYHLAVLLDEEFHKGKCTELLVFPGENRSKAMLVTLTKRSKQEAIFHLAPAH